MAEGLLTPVQHELLCIVQASRREGLTTAEIWKQFRKKHRVARTTVLKMLERLELREWLQRLPPTNPTDRVRFVATITRTRTSFRMLKHFVDDYYDGSAARMIEDLLRFKCLNIEEQVQLRHRLDRGCGVPDCAVCGEKDRPVGR
jgi:predicted transcriptional regulator